MEKIDINILVPPIAYLCRVTFSKNHCGVEMKQNHFEGLNKFRL